MIRSPVSGLVEDTAIGAVVSGLVSEVVPPGPVGYSVAWDTDPLVAANDQAAGFTITAGGEGNEALDYVWIVSDPISGAEAGSVAGSGTLAGATAAIEDIDLSELADGNITVSVWLIGEDGSLGDAATAVVLKDTVTPTGFNVAWDQESIDDENVAAASFTVTDLTGEVGSTLTYTISDTNEPVNEIEDDVEITAATMQIEALDLSTLIDGTITVSVVVTDQAGNASVADTDTIEKATT